MDDILKLSKHCAVQKYNYKKENFGKKGKGKTRLILSIKLYHAWKSQYKYVFINKTYNVDSNLLESLRNYTNYFS